VSTTATDLPTYDPAALAEALRERGLPGARSKTAITRLRRERSRRHADRVALAAAPPLGERLTRHLLARYTRVITERGGETAISGGDKGDWAQPLQIVDRDLASGLLVLHVTGWRFYGSRSRPRGYRQAALSYLCGRDESGPWAARVPGTIGDVAAALAYVIPAAVRDARQAGRRVWRQGDVYAIATTPPHDGRGTLPPRHAWDPTSRTLTHPEHGQLRLPDPVRFVPQHALAMGRGAGHGHAD
jgi:hypothetical protein